MFAKAKRKITKKSERKSRFIPVKILEFFVNNLNQPASTDEIISNYLNIKPELLLEHERINIKRIIKSCVDKKFLQVEGNGKNKLYMLSEAGKNFVKFLFPDKIEIISKILNKKCKHVYISFEEIYETIISVHAKSVLLKPEKLSIINSYFKENTLKIGKFYFVKVCLTEEELKDRIPEYPHISVRSLKFFLFKGFANRELERAANKFIRIYGKLHIDNFSNQFKEIYQIIENNRKNKK